MADINTVIKALECCTAMDEQGFPRCEECPYADPDGTCPDIDAMHRNALELLKEQTTTWVEEKDRYYHWHCEKCGFVEGAPAMTHKYCPNCGRKVMRDE